jgi:hypothetical protein
MRASYDAHRAVSLVTVQLSPYPPPIHDVYPCDDGELF